MPLIGPSMTQGASIRSQRKAAREVSVRQRRCGTLATSRVPRGERPQRRVMLVLAQSLPRDRTRKPGSRREDQALRVKPTLIFLPLPAPVRHVGPVLLAGVQAFF